ncbi:hypothetical protein MFMK1_000009 [Metallumcola ferriviriculae]|uniref:YbbR-like protein n=1 Tax=Metallumcola ferriviriculae TaxID=3039180 RepID=A0AAU0UIS4_9FIRM|nr:hypothetical protein MFMK1_000009 [Desulfitibacteraceae bacterium MK1]
MEKFWQRNLFLKIISLVVAIFMWLYVTGETNPTAETVINVPLETRALANDLVIEEKPVSVNVRVEGKKQVIQTLNSRDLRAVVDLRGVHFGRNMLEVEVDTPQNVDLVAIDPREVAVAIDEISDSQFPIIINFTGRPTTGYSTLEPVINPSQVIVAGPRNGLNRIYRAYVDVNLEGVSQNVLEHLPVKVEDELGNSINDIVRVVPQTVEVFIPIVKEQPGKQVAVNPVLEGEPADGFIIKRVIVEPELLKVYGDMDKLRNIQYLDTAPIDISGAEESVQQQVQLRLPTGVTPSVFTPIRVMVEIGAGEKPQEDKNQ